MTGSEPDHGHGHDLAGRTVLVIGASAGIGLETARQVRAEGGGVVLVGRNPERLRQAALELDPVGTAAFDAADTDRIQEFFQDLPGPVDVAALAVHIMCNGALTGATYDIDGGQQLLPR